MLHANAAAESDDNAILKTMQRRYFQEFFP
jgi:hypothetical protein